MSNVNDSDAPGNRIRPSIDLSRDPTTITLDRRLVAAKSALGPQMLDDLEVRTELDAMTGRLLVQLRSYVMAERVDEVREVVEVAYPATWWQAWKEAHPRAYRALVWPLTGHPVRYTTVEREVVVGRWAMFPENRRRYPPDLGAPVYVQQVDR